MHLEQKSSKKDKFGGPDPRNYKPQEWAQRFTLRNIKDYTLFFVDLVKVESSKVLQEIVDTLENLYDGSDEIVLSRDLIVEKIPEKLIETWNQPLKSKDEV